MFRPLPFLTAATIVALAILVGLGTWQLQRRTEKHALLDQIASRERLSPAPVEILFPTGDYAAFRRAIAQGTFDHTKEAYVFTPRTETGATLQGFRVITPFHLASGGTILIDRGWVAEDHRDPTTRAQGQTKGEVEITGVLRPSSKPATFTPSPEPKSRTFYIRDSKAIAEVLGVTLLRPLILESTTPVADGPEPLPSQTNIPDNHLSYAITWFSLALVLLVIYLRYHVVRGRLKITR